MNFTPTTHSPSSSAPSTTFSFSLLAVHSSLSSTSSPSPNLRRPKTLTSTTPSPSPPPKNPLKSLHFNNHRNNNNDSHNLTSKLRLTTKLSPPPPPPPQQQTQFNDVVSHTLTETETETDAEDEKDNERVEFRQVGKIFVGNLPHWIKKPEVFSFFRQFGPIKLVILIKGHEGMDRNLGFGFVIYGGDDAAAEEAALKAVEFDGVEFHGRCLSVKLDDGRRLRNVVRERERWVEGGGDGREFRSRWHAEREGDRKEFRRVVESQPENWQAVVRAFQRIKKVVTDTTCVLIDIVEFCVCMYFYTC